uniref:DUF659 domain-containing protein n=1 Tax=Strongyloides stercoralis TaxID=6248 RepID=A0A0K0EAX6_STRER
MSKTGKEYGREKKILFKVCSFFVSGYLLKEFISNNGKGILFQDETTLKNEELQTFILRGNANNQYYEIVLGTCEIEDKSAECLINTFEKLIGILAKVTNSFKDKLLEDTYSCIYGFMGDETTTGKKFYRLFEKKIVRCRDIGLRYQIIEYSCVAHIGSNISKQIAKYIDCFNNGKETLQFVKQVSKEFCIRSCAYHPLAIAFQTFCKDKVNKEIIGIKSMPKITSIAGNRFQVYGVICQDILNAYSELLEFSTSIGTPFDICQKINHMLQTEDVTNTIILIAYLHEIFVYPIIRSAEIHNMRDFVSYIKHMFSVFETNNFTRIIELEDIKNEYADATKISNISSLNMLSNLMENRVLQATSDSYKEKIKTVFKETIKFVNERFVNVYENIFDEQDKTQHVSLKSFTNIISERVFAQLKKTSQLAPYKTITMRCAQISAAHNKMDKVLEKMPPDELNKFFNSLPQLTKSVENDLKIWSHNITESKIKKYSDLAEKYEKKTIKSMNEIVQIIAKFSSENQKEKFLNHQLKLWKYEVKKKEPKLEKGIEKDQKSYKKLEYYVKRFSETNDLNEIISNLYDDDRNISFESTIIDDSLQTLDYILKQYDTSDESLISTIINKEDKSNENDSEENTQLIIKSPTMSKENVNDLKATLKKFY